MSETNLPTSSDPLPHIEAFVSRWNNSGAAERANYQLFLTELCDILGVPRPEPTGVWTPVESWLEITGGKLDASATNNHTNYLAQCHKNR